MEEWGLIDWPCNLPSKLEQPVRRSSHRLILVEAAWPRHQARRSQAYEYFYTTLLHPTIQPPSDHKSLSLKVTYILSAAHLPPSVLSHTQTTPSTRLTIQYCF